MIALKIIGVIVIGYLLGSIPCGLLASKKWSKKDLRSYGSGKTGTTNVLRTAGKTAALATAIGDIVKAMLAVLIAGWIFGDTSAINLVTIHTAQALAGLAAIAGHIWPVFLKFRGGRGVATYLGSLLILAWVPATGGLLVFLAVAGISRYSSLGSISGMIASCIITAAGVIWLGYPIEWLLFCCIGTAVIIIKHRDNISRLLSGTERKIGQKAEVMP